MIPVKESDPFPELPISELKWYYGDEDSSIYNRTQDTSRRISFWNDYNQLRDLVAKAKDKLRTKLPVYLDEYTKLLQDPSVSLRSKFSKVFRLVQSLIPDESHFVLMTISRDITLDPEYNTLFHDTANVTYSSTTLSSLLDIRNYLAKKTTELPLFL